MKIQSEIVKEIKLRNKIINYTLKLSLRAKRLRLAVYPDGSLVVTKPRLLSIEIVEKFLHEKENWLISRITSFKNTKIDPLNLLTRRDYLNNREKAREIITARAKFFSEIYNFKYKQINIRDQKTRWGSCSRSGNLNFNFRLLYLSSESRDYVVVHELCHLKEFNHSRAFWGLVAREVPNFRELRAKLKKGGSEC